MTPQLQELLKRAQIKGGPGFPQSTLHFCKSNESCGWLEYRCDDVPFHSLSDHEGKCLLLEHFREWLEERGFNVRHTRHGWYALRKGGMGSDLIDHIPTYVAAICAAVDAAMKEKP